MPDMGAKLYKTPLLLLLLTHMHVYTKYNLEEKLKQQMLHKFLEFYRYMNGKEGHEANYTSRQAGIEVRIEAGESVNDRGVSYNTQLCVLSLPIISTGIYSFQFTFLSPLLIQALSLDTKPNVQFNMPYSYSLILSYILNCKHNFLLTFISI